MNATINRSELDERTRWTFDVATEVIAEHTSRDGCCTTDDPCEIVAYHLSSLAGIAAGRRESTFTPEPEHAGFRPNAGTKAGNQYGTFAVKNATEKQLAYVGSLLANRDRSKVSTFHVGVLAQADAAFAKGAISKQLASDALDILVPLPLKAGVTARANVASEKQVALIAKLAAERGEALVQAALRMAGAATVAELTGGREGQASALITALFETPKVAIAPVTKAEAGMYRKGEQLIRVYLGQQSGRMLAKQVVGNEEGGFSFEYLGLAERFLTGAVRMNLEEAKAWGKTTGTCCICARRLDVPESVDAGIGPVCAGRV